MEGVKYNHLLTKDIKKLKNQYNNNRTLYDAYRENSDIDCFSNGFSPNLNNSNKKISLNEK